MKKQFKVSQGELWHRIYLIEAETLEEAKETYDTYLTRYVTRNNPKVVVKEPEFVDDNLNDTIWFDENGEKIEE
jgi:hypothetical protein